MKVETPQILWHNGSEGNGKPAPLYSVSLLPIQDANTTNNNNNNILATAGNTNEVHIWNITFPPVKKPPHSTTSSSTSKSSSTTHDDDDETISSQNKRRKILSTSASIIKHITSITRHQRSVNSISFSPKGNHLATAGDGGSFIIHTIPSQYRRSDATRYHFWKNVLHCEKDLHTKVINTHAEDVMDVSWSNDEKRILLGSLDHAVFVYEECGTVRSHQDMAFLDGGAVGNGQTSWKCVWRNTKEHTHYVQGVAFDPLGVYLASQGSDRSVRVWQRKRGNKKVPAKKQVLAAMDRNTADHENGNTALQGRNGNASMTSTDLMGKFEVGKAKMLKYRTLEREDANNSSNDSTVNTGNNPNSTSTNPAATSTTTTPTVKKRHLFADESSVESFFRRLAWTRDGAFLITPASLWHSNDTTTSPTNAKSSSSSALSSPSFATYLFARHQYEQPFKVFFGLEKPSVAIRPNPLLFQLPKDVQSNTKENMEQKPSCMANKVGNVPYRSIFAVLTIDSILIYDTYHPRPLCVARGLHYAGLTDCTWSADGKNLIVCSTDGYISILSFAQGELGEVYTPNTTSNTSGISNDAKDVAIITNTVPSLSNNNNPLRRRAKKAPLTIKHTLSSSSFPPCEPGQSATLVAPPAKRARFDKTKGEKKRVTPMLLSTSHTNVEESKDQQQKQQQVSSTETMDIQQGDTTGNNCVETEVVGGVTNLSLNNELQQQQQQGIGSVY